MYFTDVQSLLQMDGHGGFVWASYAAMVVVVGLLLALPLRRQRQLLRDIDGEIRRNQSNTVKGDS